MNKRKKQEGISLRDAYEFVAGRWYWFLLSIIICTGGMCLYLLMQEPVYQRTATILIQDDKSTRADAYILTIKSNEDNGIADKIKILTSSKVMKNVVNKLDLEVLYNTQLLLRKQDCYDETPIFVNFLNDYIDYTEFSIVPITHNKCNLIVDNKVISVHFGDTIKLENNQFFISKTPNFTKESFNKQVDITRIYPEKATSLYRSNVLAKANDGSNTVNLTYTGTSIKRADDILNVLFEEFNF